jgi:hypothetical protein
MRPEYGFCLGIAENHSWHFRRDAFSISAIPGISATI